MHHGKAVTVGCSPARLVPPNYGHLTNQLFYFPSGRLSDIRAPVGAGEAAEADRDGEDETLPAAKGEAGHRQAALLRLRRAQPRQVRKGKILGIF